MQQPWSMSTFRAMASPCRVIAPDAAVVAEAEALVHRLEALWSRFDPSSEISRLNRTNGELTIVSAETFELVSLAEWARTATCGIYNPLMLSQLCTAGYDASWEHIRDSSDNPVGCIAASNEPIELFADVCGVRLPKGVEFDPGGIGKGLAADMVARRLAVMGAASSQIELGGDVRLSGPNWHGGNWDVTVDDREHDRREAASITIPYGGVATSSSTRRSWQRGRTRMHHLLDPSTGRPAVTDLASATVVAPTLWWAEVVAKVVVIEGSRRGRRRLEDLSMSGVLVARGEHADRYTAIETMDTERVGAR